ncbi:hypothetical protein GGX14DRAFT_364947, partial [Mycena pura]
LARVVQRLPVTELKVATLAFAVLNVFIWALWWGKPLDVQDPIVIASGSADLPEFQLQVLRRLDRSYQAPITSTANTQTSRHR